MYLVFHILFCMAVLTHLYFACCCIYMQGSPNQVKWVTSSPWFQWNCPISVKKRSFSHPVSLFKSVFFSPIIILFLQYSHKRMFLNFDPYRVWCSIFYSKLVNCILFKIIVHFVKGRGTCGSGERNFKIWIDFRKSPRFSLTSSLSQEREKCGEPCTCNMKLTFQK
jgi:hypothetical protein